MTPSARFALAFAWLSSLLLGCGDTPPSEAPELPQHAVTQWTDSTELFMEYPTLLVGDTARFAVHLTDLTDFAPLRSGRVRFRLTPTDGDAPTAVVQEEPRRPGIYGPDVSLDRPGRYDLTILVESPQARDSIEVRGIMVYGSAADVPIEEASPTEAIPFLKEQQWNTAGFQTVFADTGRVAAGVAAPGRLAAAAGREAVVSAPIAGLVLASGVASAPVPGQRVTRDQVLAILTPTLGDGGAVYAAARAELRRAEQELARAEALLKVEAVPAKRVEEAQIRVDAAREALAGLVGGAQVEEGRVTVRAPIGGVVTERRLVPGTRVAAGDPLFGIVESSVLWLEAEVSAADLSQVRRPAGARFFAAGDSASRRAGRLISVGGVIDSLTRGVTLRFEVANPNGELRVGELVRVTVLSGHDEAGVVVPAAAVVDDDGQPVVYVQPEGEAFERRVVTLGPRADGRVVIRTGVRAGERVVSGAAAMVRLASRSSALPAHGHEH